MTLVQFSGLASGIDSSALIQALIDRQRQALVEPYQNRISSYQDQNEALKEMRSLLSTLTDSADKFRTLHGGSLTRQAVSSDELVLTAAASNAAIPGYYDLQILQSAKNGTLSLGSTGHTYTSADAVLAPGLVDTGNNLVEITVGSAAGGEQELVQITVNAATTLTEFVSQFNTLSQNATASLVNLGSGGANDYVVLLTSKDSGLVKGEISVNIGADITTASSLDNNAASQARNAIFSVDGIAGTIARQSNSVSDLLPGLTFNIEATGTATIAVSTDIDSTRGLVEELVDAFNEVVKFIKDNDTVARDDSGRDPVNIFGALALTSLDNSVLTILRSALSESRSSGGQISILAEMGITSERDGTLKFDGDIFKTALEQDPDSVSRILQNLGDKLAGPTGTIAQFTRFNGLIDSSIRESESAITRLQDKTNEAERRLEQQEQSLVRRFARLEALMGRMQSQQTSLSAILQPLQK